MNPFKLLTVYRKANAVLSLLEQTKMNKSLFKSKTFWFNLLTGLAQFAQVIPLSPEWTVLIVAGINVGLRLVTDTPVVVLK